MTGKDEPFDWDKAFEEKAEENRREYDRLMTDPQAVAARKAKREADIEREKRQGLRDEDGNWIFPEETDNEDEEEDEDEI